MSIYVDDVPFETSRVPVSGDYLRYVKPPRNSYDWMGAAWDDTALSFESETVTAQMMGQVVMIHRPTYDDADATLAFRHMHDVVEHFAETLRADRQLVDRGHRVRVRLMAGKMELRAKTWPAITGVTYLAEDDTR